MTTRLERFTQKARAEPQLRFTALVGLLFDSEGRHASFERQDGRKAPGVDGIRKEMYAQGLDERIVDLPARLRRLDYGGGNGENELRPTRRQGTGLLSVHLFP